MAAPIQDILSLEHDAIVELFELDLNPIGVAVALRFCNYAVADEAVVWQGQVYEPYPIQVQGFEYAGRGQLPAPRMTLSNIGGIVTAVMLGNENIRGAKLTRFRTIKKYLDGQPEADPTKYYEPEIYYVDRPVEENKLVVTYELGSNLDVEGRMIPGRPIIANTCPWEYRGADCGYTGTTYFNRADLPVADPSQDVCSKTLKGCELRFGWWSELPFGGFPGADNIR